MPFKRIAITAAHWKGKEILLKKESECQHRMTAKRWQWICWNRMPAALALQSVPLPLCPPFPCHVMNWKIWVMFWSFGCSSILRLVDLLLLLLLHCLRSAVLSAFPPRVIVCKCCSFGIGWLLVEKKVVKPVFSWSAFTPCRRTPRTWHRFTAFSSNCDQLRSTAGVQSLLLLPTLL